jgi:hypothetical protein
MTGDVEARSRVPVLLVLIGMLLAVIAGVAIFSRSSPVTDDADQDPTAPQVASAVLDRLIFDSQARLRRLLNDAATWARLGPAYVEQARITADPTYYTKAQGALERSLEVRPDDNGEAMLGMGVLANARHDFHRQALGRTGYGTAALHRPGLRGARRRADQPRRDRGGERCDAEDAGSPSRPAGLHPGLVPHGTGGQGGRCAGDVRTSAVDGIVPGRGLLRPLLPRRARVQQRAPRRGRRPL